MFIDNNYSFIDFIHNWYIIGNNSDSINKTESDWQF